MPNLSNMVGVVLVVLGLWGYTQGVSHSPMALFPAVFGVLFLACGIVGAREGARKHAMHAAAALALVGILAGVGPAFMMPNAPPMMRRQTAGMAVVCAFFLFMAVRSFRAARRARTAA